MPFPIRLLAEGEEANFQNKVHLAMATAGFSDVKQVGEQ